MDSQKNDEYSSSSPQPENCGMKWHKFLIYFSLWASAVLSALSAFSYFTGILYGDSANAVYAYFSGLKTLDVLMGFVSLLLAVFCIYVRFQLAGFKTGADKKIVYLYIANAVIPVLYLVAASSVTGISIGDLASDSWYQIAGSVAMIFVNQIYYKKREALFVN